MKLKHTRPTFPRSFVSSSAGKRGAGQPAKAGITFVGMVSNAEEENAMDAQTELMLSRMRHRDLVRAAQRDRQRREARQGRSVRRGYAVWLSRVAALFFVV